MRTLLFSESPMLTPLLGCICLGLTYKYPYQKVFLVFLCTFCFLVWFYRYPDRSCNTDRDAGGFLWSACDGTILEIEETETTYRIATFLSPFNVHVQYYPCDGVIKHKKYKKGTFNPAFYKKSKHNERLETTMETKVGDVVIIQIAGVFVRRIVGFHAIGDHVSQGDGMGMIKFGSRVDVVFPKQHTRLLVSQGDRVREGHTKLASYAYDSLV